MQRLIIGTYPVGETAGSGEGLWEVYLDQASGTLTGARLLVETPSPSFVALHPDGGTVFAVAELDEGRVTAFALTGDALEERESRPTRGVHPCHVVARERVLWVANYSSGTFTVLGLDADGAFTDEVASFGHAGSGPDASRQEGPHAHYCLSAPNGDDAWVVDLGTDEIRRYTTDEIRRYTTAAGTDGTAGAGAAVPLDGIAAAGIAARLPAGAGPRHAVAHPSGTVFVVGELDSRVHLLRTDPTAVDAWEAYASLPACVTADPGTGSYPSHIALSADGSRLYVAVRGPDVLSTFAVTADGTSITHLADTPIGGVWPRHFAVVTGDAGHDGDLVVVANQNSSNLAVLRIDPVTGVGEIADHLDLPAPACVLPV
ncbi:6-phosphogluconolactonase, cycloisomerase 2 family [Sanguibacter gelidistatuariae]|uniref:6-phosphogluconolactonase, cycloisomerase 2 family n=1 Tax=Sanguibacter gelidistatuariae TaxID=1814289 RepID=A0A1G6HVH1_9MICO|nr:lactonase family protein [Sanguibacter gelidistatuariae]SDB97835.1 6-phosphogluconolactonase, cycloisomerase 2 family [Sanguibacter gelidistatuariae]